MNAIKIGSLDTDLKYVVNAFFGSGALGCYTCNTCTVECPVNKYVGRLDPRKIVRMAALGMKDDLLGSIDIWLCMQCKKCNNICPQMVEPASAIRFFRNLAAREDVVSSEFVRFIEDIDDYVQKLRGKVYVTALNLRKDGKTLNLHKLLMKSIDESPVTGSSDETVNNRIVVERLLFGEFPDTGFVQCLTCRECTASCVVSRSVKEFDPVKIMRSFYLGQEDKLLDSSDLWLCMSCETCTAVCRQGVKGSILINRLKNRAIERGVLPADIVDDLAEIDQSLHEVRAELISRAWEKRKDKEFFDLNSEIKKVIGS